MSVVTMMSQSTSMMQKAAEDYPEWAQKLGETITWLIEHWPLLFAINIVIAILVFVVVAGEPHILPEGTV